MTGFVLLLVFGAAAWGAVHLWQQHGRRAPIRELESRREDLEDLSDEADLEDEIEEKTEELRARGYDLDDEENH